MAKGHGHGKGGMRKEARTPENLIRNAGKQEPKGGQFGHREQKAFFYNKETKGTKKGGNLRGNAKAPGQDEQDEQDWRKIEARTPEI